MARRTLFRRRPMSLIGYARVFAEQDLAPQLDALRAAGATRIFEDRGVSGARIERPGLNAALSFLRDGDVLVVGKLDRLGRSMTHLLQTVADLEDRGVGFRSLTENIDTTPPPGGSCSTSSAHSDSLSGI